MENFTVTVTAATTWTKLATLLAADATFKGQYVWKFLLIKNTHGANALTVKDLPGTDAPASTTSGWHLAAGAELRVEAGQGLINGDDIWLYGSGANTTVDVLFVRHSGR